ncbi:MAG TPA: tetraacyldisaccharide 4'-kinase [Saprospiraceae bacterium]|nr:tetraacyldisaccharide 4'-kinase [Saprospiraceae bacterium]
MNLDNTFLRWLLFPLSLLFGLVVAIKNILYKRGVLTGVRFNIPIISVGNLTVGGAGKTPQVEYLVRLLRDYLRTAVMSRGFGRSTIGFLLVRPEHQSDEAGDESLLFARKYRNVTVAVSESRSLGIPLLLQHRPELQVIFLDDAYQHRSVSPHLNILLTEYDHPFYTDWLMPSGSLREWRSGYHRADIIIVTKCLLTLSEDMRLTILKRLRPLPHQTVYFSAYRYHHPYSMYTPGARIELSEKYSVLLVCGIAKPDYLFEYVYGRCGHVDLMQFGDHHIYQNEDLDIITSRFHYLPGDYKMILTTEKDAVRLESFGPLITSRNLPIYLLPLEVVFLFQEGVRFDNHIRRFLLEFKV